MAAATTDLQWRQQTFGLSRAFYHSPESQVNQKSQARLYETINNYSQKGCLSKLLHTICQIFRFIFTFGNTEWVSTRKELMRVVRHDLKTDILLNLPEKLAGQIKKMACDRHPEDEASKVKFVVNEEARAAESILEKIKVKEKTNQLMLDLLTVEKAGKFVDIPFTSGVTMSKKNKHGEPVYRSLIESIMSDEKSLGESGIDNHFVDLLVEKVGTNEEHKGQRTLQLNDRESFKGNPRLQEWYDNIPKRLKGLGMKESKP